MKNNVRYHIFAYAGIFYIVINFHDEYKLYRKSTLRNSCNFCSLYDNINMECQISSEEDFSSHRTHLCNGGYLELIAYDSTCEEFKSLVKRSIKAIENKYLLIDILSATIESEYCKDICPYSGKCIPNCIKDLLIKKFNDKL